MGIYKVVGEYISDLNDLPQAEEYVFDDCVINNAIISKMSNVSFLGCEIQELEFVGRCKNVKISYCSVKRLESFASTINDFTVEHTKFGNVNLRNVDINGGNFTKVVAEDFDIRRSILEDIVVSNCEAGVIMTDGNVYNRFVLNSENEGE